MIHQLSIKITNYIQNNTNIKNNDDIEKINYALQTIINETSKLVILSIMFLLIKHFKYFIFSMVILFSIRIFSGGIHSETFFGCLVWTSVFFIATSVIAPMIPIFNSYIYYIISILNIIIVVKYAPYPNYLRPIKNKKRRQQLKKLAIFFTLLWTWILLLFLNNQFLNCGMSTILLQLIQLVYERKSL